MKQNKEIEAFKDRLFKERERVISGDLKGTHVINPFANFILWMIRDEVGDLLPPPIEKCVENLKALGLNDKEVKDLDNVLDAIINNRLDNYLKDKLDFY